MAHRPAARDSGFTLLEVVIAFVIAALALAALVRAGGSALYATQTASRYQEAVSRAESHLAATTHGPPLRAGDNQGDDGGGFHWRVRVARADATTLPPLGLLRRAALPITLYAVTVWISWGDAAHRRAVRLYTEQIGQTGS
jgi:general secretion pathway protein I